MQSATMLFAQRQHALIKGGLSEKEAYAAAEAMEGERREAALAEVAALTAAARAEGAKAPALLRGLADPFSEGGRAEGGAAGGGLGGSSYGGLGSSADPMGQYGAWRQRIADEPYEMWDLGAQVRWWRW